MKFGIRRPSLIRKVAARTSIKRYAVNKFGLKLPRGYGWIRDPKRFVYSKIYNRVSITPSTLIDKLFGFRPSEIPWMILEQILIALHIGDEQPAKSKIEVDATSESSGTRPDPDPEPEPPRKLSIERLPPAA